MKKDAWQDLVDILQERRPKQGARRERIMPVEAYDGGMKEEGKKVSGR